MTTDTGDDTAAPDWRRSWRKRAEIAAIAGVGAPLLGALARTVSWETVGREHLDAMDRAGRPHIFALWHGRILPCMWYFRDRGIVVVTSENFDGEWIARIIQRFGFGAARGSSSRGGARALRSLLRSIASQPAAFTVDGPRGPRGVAQPGIVWLARATGHPIIPIHAEAATRWTLRSWDRTQVPKPWSRVVMAIGAPLTVPQDADEAGLEAARQAVEAALGEVERQASAACGRPPHEE
ncbi:MAG: lysophospholipid acyltransferase family protein [Vicinamibacterales bacterium]